MTTYDAGRCGGDLTRLPAWADRHQPLLDLSSRSCPYGPPPAAIAALAALVQHTPAALAERPGDDALAAYVTAWADYLIADPAHLVAVPGIEYALGLLARLLATEDIALVTPEVAEIMDVFGYTTTLYGPGSERDDGDQRLQRLQLAMERHDAVVLSNPGELGHRLAAEDLLQACRDHPQCLLIVVEEQLDAGTLGGAAQTNLVILRSTEAPWGLAGVRAGVLWSRDSGLRRAFAAQLPLMPLSLPDCVAGAAALRDTSWPVDVLDRLAADGQDLDRLLARHFGGEAVQDVDAGSPTRFIHQAVPRVLYLDLLPHGVVVQVLNGKEHGWTPGVRLRIPGTPEGLAQLRAALNTVRPEELRPLPPPRTAPEGGAR